MAGIAGNRGVSSPPAIQSRRYRAGHRTRRCVGRREIGCTEANSSLPVIRGPPNRGACGQDRGTARPGKFGLPQTDPP
jgi:hypothetical protein